ncbi:hypothetical protein GOODEAATRI_013311, partial [Goodea atripinnis]
FLTVFHFHKGFSRGFYNQSCSEASPAFQRAHRAEQGVEFEGSFCEENVRERQPAGAHAVRAPGKATRQSNSFDRKRQYELLKLERDFQKQANVLRRKTEEVVKHIFVSLISECKRNAKLFLHLRKSCTVIFILYTLCQTWLLNEMEVMVSTEEARRHLSDLLDDRKVLAQEINNLKQQIEAGERPAPKIRVLYLLNQLQNKPLGRCSNKQCRCRKGKMTCGENCQCDHERCRNLDNQVTAEFGSVHLFQDTSIADSIARDSASLQDPSSDSPENSTFFKPPSCTPTKKVRLLKTKRHDGSLAHVLKEIGDMGHSTAELKLVRKPVLTEEDEGQEDDNEEDRTTISFLKKKKRLLTSFQNSFFSGCTPIREES